MEYHIIGAQKKEYNKNEFPTKYYLHVAEYPHLIQVNRRIYNDVLEKSIDSLNFPTLKVTEYNGRFYYKYETIVSEEKEKKEEM